MSGERSLRWFHLLRSCIQLLIWAHLSTFEVLILNLKLLHSALADEHLIDHLHLLVSDHFHVRGQLQVLPLQVLHLELHRGQLLILKGELRGQ